MSKQELNLEEDFSSIRIESSILANMIMELTYCNVFTPRHVNRINVVLHNRIMDAKENKDVLIIVQKLIKALTNFSKRNSTDRIIIDLDNCKN